jgi:hypothetical protein
VRIGGDADFRSALARIDERIKKTKTPVNDGWFELVNGGRDGSYVLVLLLPMEPSSKTSRR